jgi:circadian clock protein KaiC
MHVARMHKLIEGFKPAAVIIDPLTNLTSIGDHNEVRSAILRLVDLLKMRHITAFFTSLTRGGEVADSTSIGVSSLMDTWILLVDIESSGERNRGLYVLKSRGMAHSNQIREFQLTNNGIRLRPAYLGPGGVLTGAAREVQEAKERAEQLVRDDDIERQQRELARKRKALEAQIDMLRASHEAEQEDLQRILSQAQSRENIRSRDKDAMARLRQAPRPSFTNQGLPYTAGESNDKAPQKTNNKKAKTKRTRR